jgi:hypothetical protein
MRTRIGELAAVAGLALALGASASRAAIVETIINSDEDVTVGSITFPSLTGDSDAGVVFSYGGFTQADITSISWTLDPATSDVVALDLNALQGDNPCPNDSMDCSNRTVNLSPTLAEGDGTSCSFFDDTGECERSLQQADIEFVPLAVPERSTWAMLVVGFAGLGLAGRRLNRQTARRALKMIAA